MSNGKVMIIILIAGLMKNEYKMSQYFPKLYNRFDGNVNVE